MQSFAKQRPASLQPGRRFRIAISSLVALTLPVSAGAAFAATTNLVKNGGLVPSDNLRTGPKAAPSAGINKGTGVGGTIPSIYSIPEWTVTDNPKNVGGWVNNLMYSVSSGKTFSRYGYGLNSARQNGRKNWTLFGAPTQEVHSVDGSGWYLASDGDPKYSGSISQEIFGLTVGDEYKVEFWQAAGQFDCSFNYNYTVCEKGPYNQPTTNWWEVTFGGVTQNSTVISQPKNANVSPWHKQILTFTANAASMMLSFLANGTPGEQPPTALLSAISVTGPGDTPPPDEDPPDTPDGPTPPNDNPSIPPPFVPPSVDEVPGPLGILGVGAAFQVSRSMRRRIKRSQS